MRPFLLITPSLKNLRLRSTATSRVYLSSMYSFQGEISRNRNADGGQRRRGQSGRGRGYGSWRKNKERFESSADAHKNNVWKADRRPKLTHFIAIPLVGLLNSFSRLAELIRLKGHLPAVQSAAESFRASLLAQTPPIEGLDPSIIVSSRRLHLTLGVMSLVEETSPRENLNGEESESVSTVSSALSLLYQLRPRILEALGGHPLRVLLSSLDIMKGDTTRAHILFTGPSERDLKSEDGHRLKRVSELINSEFVRSGLVVDEKRPLKLHCTLLNTSYRKPRAKGPRVPFSFRDIRECPSVMAWAGSSERSDQNFHESDDVLSASIKEGTTAVMSQRKDSAAAALVARETRRMDPEKPQACAIPAEFGTHVVSEIQICRMGSWGPEGEYVCVGKIDL